MNLNLTAPINQLGYGITGLNILKALQDKGIKVSLFPIGQPQVTNQEDAERVTEAIERSKFYDPFVPCVKIWHQHDLAQFAGSRLIGFPIFELDTFSDLEKHQIKSCNQIFVCSDWAKDVCVKNEVTYFYQRNSNYHDTQVIPLGVDTGIFKPCEQNKSSKTIFYNCGKWEIRKGHDILRQAFDLAFSGIDDVELWMQCENPFNTAEEEQEWNKLYNSSRSEEHTTELQSH